MNLSFFPSEIFGLILGFSDSSYLVINLWKCGCTVLNAKLAQIITEVDVGVSDPSSTIFYPRMLISCRNLRKLFFTTIHSDTSNTIKWSNELLLLPKTLEDLRFAPSQDAIYFVNYAPSSTPSSPVPIITNYPRGPSMLIDFETLFPRLIRLEVQSFPTEGLSALPPTLKVLGSSVPLQPTREGLFCSLLPPSFETLHATLYCIFAIRDWDMAPPHWSHVDIARLDDDLDSDLSFLPRSIKTGNWSCFHSWDATKALTAPPHLEQLDINGMDLGSFTEKNLKWSSSLPQSLKTLSLRTWGLSFAQNVPWLPRSLTSITTFGADEGDWHALVVARIFVDDASFHARFWPPGLVSLSLAASWLSPGELELLPRTLTELSLNIRASRGPELPKIDAKNFAPSLRSFSCQYRGPLLQVTNNWPASLTRFSFTNDEDPNVGLMKDAFEKLPDSIRFMYYGAAIAGENGTSDLPWKLPKRLLNLGLLEWRCDWFSAIPDEVQEVSVTRLGVTSIGNDWGAENSPIWSGIQEYAKDLPSTVNQLHCGAQGIQLSAKQLNELRKQACNQ